MIYNVAVALAVLAVASANLHDRAFYEEKFFEWMQEHKMEIGTGSSFVKMLQNFADNHDIIENHNAGTSTYQLGHNKFSHMGRDEWKAFIGSGLNRPTLRSEAAQHVVSGATPASVDWVSGGLVTNVKDQGQCGSCWSFSATGALEGAWAKSGHALTSFAPQEFVDCDIFRNGGTDMGCNGGLMDSAFKWAMKQPGLCNWDSYTYTASQGTCSDSKCNNQLGVPKGYTDVPKNNADAFKNALAQQPLSIAIEADQASFQLYKSGVFTGACGTSLDHGVLAVGYGLDSASGLNFWNVKNSWGTGWGESGYIRFTAEPIAGQPEGQCGLYSGPASYPSY